jgi:glyoxylase-like metal-dependent hydrolase (beta-lactamase superfamily II)
MNIQQCDFPRKLADGLWLLGNYFFNIYLVKGTRGAALFESGISATVDAVARQLESLDARPDYFVVLHPHPDHINGLPGLRSMFPAARIIAGPGAAAFASHPKTAQSLVAEDLFMSEFLKDQGIPAGRPPISEAPSLEGCIEKTEGDCLDLGGLSVRFLSAPGHAIGALAAYVPEIRAVLASDCLGFRFPGVSDFFPLFFTGYSDYMSTIGKLEALEPEILGLAHQGPITGEYVREAFRRAQSTASAIRELVLSGAGEDGIIETIFNKYYRDELKMYTRDNIITCCRLIIKRSRESI